MHNLIKSQNYTLRHDLLIVITIISLFTILLIMEFSNEFKLDSKKVINGYKIRNLQTQYTTPFTTPYTIINGTNNTHINISPKSRKGLRAGGIIEKLNLYK